MDSIADIVSRLSDNAEAVCRRYLPAGRREGRYWLVGNIHGAPGRSLYVLLSGEGGARGRAGKWTDAASGDHGDLLDIIAARCGHASMRDTLAEARRFLSLPMPLPDNASPRARKGSEGTPAAARRLWAAAKPIEGTPVAAYLASRGLGVAGAAGSLRYYPRCFYRASLGDASDVRSAWPAMIAAVTDDRGSVVGVHRTWLTRSGGKAPVADPRRAMGHLLGHGVRFGAAGEMMVAGEGIETILSLREALRGMPMIAGLSAAHLAAIVFPAALRRLYVAFDRDPAGTGALRVLAQRAAGAGIELVPLPPECDDFNDDLRALGRARFAARLRRLLRSDDAERFLDR